MGDGKREQPERDAASPSAGEPVEVDFQPGDEHDIEQPDFAEHLDGLPACDDVQPVRADQRAAGQQQDQVGNPQPSRNQRGEQDHQHQERERQRRVLNRKCLRDINFAVLDQLLNRRHAFSLAVEFFGPVCRGTAG
ncbi:hypothetical protein SDC9_148991 [bioreactor metagenome]|uniref:Uncharacterized protein n=1 Tax=bioreactor metagenome TaxID=1076179 RepID=A0A645EKX7_9ZZZZ